jgi:hypothetical protein
LTNKKENMACIGSSADGRKQGMDWKPCLCNKAEHGLEKPNITGM